MNLKTLLTDDDIIKGIHLVQTLAPGQARQICFQCEKPIAARSHYRVQITGASGHLLGLQICLQCQEQLRRGAIDRRRDGHPDPINLTQDEQQVRPPQPINLGSIYAPKFGTAASHAADAIQHKEDLFDA